MNEDDYATIEDKLPKHRQRVHIVVQSPYGTDVDGEVDYFTATFLKGEKAAEDIAFCVIDKNGNKVRPNRWACGPFRWRDEEILYWEPIKQPGKLKDNPKYIQRCRNKIANKQKFEEAYKDYDNGIEEDIVSACAGLFVEE